MARQTNAAYWAQRMKNMEDALLDQSYSYVENLEKQFAAAQAEIERQMARWYQRFATNNEIDLALFPLLLRDLKNHGDLFYFHRHIKIITDKIINDLFTLFKCLIHIFPFSALSFLFLLFAFTPAFFPCVPSLQFLISRSRSAYCDSGSSFRFSFGIPGRKR